MPGQDTKNGGVLQPKWFAVAAVVAAAVVAGWWLTSGGADGAGHADAGDEKLVALGKVVYAKACASCHGANLEGEKNWREPRPEGGLRAPPHDATGHTWHHADDLLFRITKYGGRSVAPKGFKSNMPAFGEQYSDREIWAVLAYIKSRWPDRVREIHARVNARSRNR